MKASAAITTTGYDHYHHHRCRGGGNDNNDNYDRWYCCNTTTATDAATTSTTFVASLKVRVVAVLVMMIAVIVGNPEDPPHASSCGRAEVAMRTIISCRLWVMSGATMLALQRFHVCSKSSSLLASRLLKLKMFSSGSRVQAICRGKMRNMWRKQGNCT